MPLINGCLMLTVLYVFSSSCDETIATDYDEMDTVIEDNSTLYMYY